MHLTWDDARLDDAELIVSRHVQDRYVRAWSPKDHELRTIPIPKQFVELLRLFVDAENSLDHLFELHAQ